MIKTILWSAGLLIVLGSSGLASTWQDHKKFGFHAFGNQDFRGAVQQFKVALTIAYEDKAPAEKIGELLENLTMAYLAAGQPEHAWEAIERWDRILDAFPDEPWTHRQLTIINALAPLALDALIRSDSS